MLPHAVPLISFFFISIVLISQCPALQPPLPRLDSSLFTFSLCLCVRLTQAEAEAQADRLETDGKDLYQLSPEEWIEKFDYQGQTIYNELQEGRSGHVSFMLFFSRLLPLVYGV